MFRECIELEENCIISAEDPPFLVAEIGLNHNNDIEIGKRTIEAAAKSGAKAVKFQTYHTDFFISRDIDDAKPLYEIFKRYELNEEKHRIFQKIALDNGLVFFSTPLDPGSVDFLVSLGVPALKIASGDIVNSELLAKAASTGLPIFLSTGASTLLEVIRAMEFLKDCNVKSLCLMHCISLYPPPYKMMNMRTISFYHDLTDGPIGFSDHSQGSIAPIMAVTLGASVIEKHFTLDKNLPGPDHKISADPHELKQISESIRIAYEMRGNRGKLLSSMEEESHYLGRRSLYIDPSGKLRSLRPNLHKLSQNYPESWEYLFLSGRLDLKPIPNRTRPIEIQDIQADSKGFS